MLEFRVGAPAAALLYDHLDVVHGVQAFLGALRGESLAAVRRGFFLVGVEDTAFLLFSELMDLQSLFLTADSDTVYFWGFVDRADGPMVLNTYGPTEATVTATGGVCVSGAAITIGRPLTNYDAYLLDDDLQPVSPRRPGEVCLGGPGLALGYVGRDDLTLERFIPSPCKRHDDEPDRLYRTGDLACLTDDGEIDFLGRIDTQVKFRGFRIELTEIESQLMAAPGVRAAAVGVHDLTPGIPSLVGHVVPHEGEACPLRLIDQHLRRYLPPSMAPRS